MDAPVKFTAAKSNRLKDKTAAKHLQDFLSSKEAGKLLCIALWCDIRPT